MLRLLYMPVPPWATDLFVDTTVILNLLQLYSRPHLKDHPGIKASPELRPRIVNG